MSIRFEFGIVPARAARFLAAILLGAALVVAGCSESIAPAPTSASLPVVSRPTPEPCLSGLLRIGDFTQRFADDLARVRPLVSAKTFESAQTMAAIRRMSATLTAYSDLESTLRSCPTAAGLVSPLSDLMGAANKAAAAAIAASESDQVKLRAAAVQLFVLLPADLQLSAIAVEVAKNLGRELAVAEVPQEAAEPIGSLPPLPTPTPSKRPTAARPSAAPTAVPAAKPGIATPRSGWTLAAYNTALKYQDSTWNTYTLRIPDALWNAGAKLFGATCDGGTSEERAGCFDNEVKSIYLPIRSAIRDHVAFMKKHPAARCFADAYTADRAVGAAYLNAADSLEAVLTSSTNAGYYAAFKAWDKWLAIAESRSTAFLKRFDGYFNDCR